LFFWPHGHASKELALLFWCIANCHNGRDGAGQAGNYELRAKRNYSASPVLPNADRSVQFRPIPTRLGPLKKRNEQPGDAHKVSAENGGHKISRSQESAFACGQQKWRGVKGVAEGLQKYGGLNP